MKTLNTRYLMTAPVLALLVSGSAMAQDALTCADLEFTDRILEVLPQANDACREVVMKDGRPFARFNAEIVSNRGGTVRAKFKQAGGGYTDVIEFHPDQSSRLRIGGENMRWWDVTAGQQLDIYLPPDRFEIATHDDHSADFASTTAAVSTVSVSKADQLPSTASPVPLIGALGGLLVALGAGLTAIRRRLGRA